MKNIKRSLLTVLALNFTIFTHCQTPMVGGNSKAPQIFQAIRKYSDKGLIGNYFVNTQIATIHDPSGANPTSYTFENVKEVSLIQKAPAGLERFGILVKQNKCSMSGACSNAVQGPISLYGKLKRNA